MQARTVENVVRSVLTDRFPDAKVAKIAIRSDVDNDGDDILRVIVVLEGVPSQLDKKALVGFVRHLRSRLEEVNHEEFPILSFISKSEAKNLDLETA